MYRHFLWMGVFFSFWAHGALPPLPDYLVQKGGAWAKQFEEALQAGNVPSLENLLSQGTPSPKVMGFGLLRAVAFDQLSLALALLRSHQPIDSQALQDIYKSPYVKDPVLLDLIKARLPKTVQRPRGPLPKTPPHMVNLVILGGAQAPEWMVFDLHAHPELFSHFVDMNQQKMELEGPYRTYLSGGFRDVPGFSAESFLAHLLALKYLNPPQAEATLKVIKSNHPALLKGFDDKKFHRILDSVFSRPPFSDFGERFSASHFPGHVRSAEKEETPDEASHGEGSPPANSETFVVHVLGKEHRLSYETRRGGVTPPKAVVIRVYTGHNMYSNSLVRPVPFNDPAIWSIGLNLWDSETPLFQLHQLNDIRNTHGSYLAAVSQFIAYLRTDPLYKDVKIFLMGESFGGFFVTSYAMLQSVFEQHLDLHEVYGRTPAYAFHDLFPGHQVSPVAGVIGMIPYVEGLSSLGPPELFRHLIVPTFLAIHNDDDRVVLKEMLHVLREAPLGVVEFYTERSAASPYGADLRHVGDTEEISTTDSTTRGHNFGGDAAKSQQHKAAVTAFIDRITAGRTQMSPVQRALNKRRYDLTVTNLGAFFVTGSDQKRFVSNLNLLQHRIAPGRVAPPLSAEARLDWAMEGISAVTPLALVKLSLTNPAFLDALSQRFGTTEEGADYILFMQNWGDSKEKTIEELTKTFRQMRNPEAFLEKAVANISAERSDLQLAARWVQGVFQERMKDAQTSPLGPPLSDEILILYLKLLIEDTKSLEGKTLAFLNLSGVPAFLADALKKSPEVLKTCKEALFATLTKLTTTGPIWKAAIQGVRQKGSTL